MFEFIRAVWQFVKKGCLVVSDEIVKERFGICKGCAYNSDTVIEKCTICGCYIQLKIRCATEKCPKFFW